MNKAFCGSMTTRINSLLLRKPSGVLVVSEATSWDPRLMRNPYLQVRRLVVR